MSKPVRSFRETVYAFLWALADGDLPNTKRLANEIARRGSPEQKFSAIEYWIREHGDAHPLVAEWARKELAEARSRRRANEEPDYTGKAWPGMRWMFR